MVDWIDALIGLALGLGVGGAIIALLGRSRLSGLESENALLERDLTTRTTELDATRTELAEANARRETAQQRVTGLEEQVKAEQARLLEQRSLLDDAQNRLRDAFRAVGAETLEANSRQFLDMARKVLEGQLLTARTDHEKRQQAIDSMVKPIRELLDQHNTAVRDIEKKREVAYGRLEEQIRHIAASHDKLGTATDRLVTALRRPEQRGRWGEMQLRNVVELAGMTAHCDFDEQVATDDPNTRDRPDMTINLPGGGAIVVDAKVALEAYLDALQPGADRDVRLDDHAALVEKHYRGLAAKKYWDQFERTPKLVVMFMPLESALVAALEVKPDLHAQAMSQNVLIATPTLLVALLRAVAYGWQQEALAKNAREISEVGRALYDRLATFAGHVEKVGTHLRRSTQAYNSAVGSLDRMVLSGARKLKALHATTEDDIPTPAAVEVELRELVSEELVGNTETSQRRDAETVELE